jgi:hypothetical protein
MHSDVLVSAELVILLSVLVSIILRVAHRRRKRLTIDLTELLKQLEPLSKSGLETVATDMLEPTAEKVDPCSDARMTGTMTWELVGGMDGLSTMEKNAEILLEITFYLHQCNPELADVAEHLRLGAQDIRTEVRALKKLARKHPGDLAVSSRVQRAVGAYYLMIRRVIALAEVNNAALAFRLTELLL